MVKLTVMLKNINVKSTFVIGVKIQGKNIIITTPEIILGQAHRPGVNGESVLVENVRKENQMENEYGWNNKKLGKAAADFCYDPGKKDKRANAAAWVIENLVLPIGCPNGYTEKGMAHLIKVRLDEIEEAAKNEA